MVTTTATTTEMHSASVSAAELLVRALAHGREATYTVDLNQQLLDMLLATTLRCCLLLQCRFCGVWDAAPGHALMIMEYGVGCCTRSCIDDHGVRSGMLHLVMH